MNATHNHLLNPRALPPEQCGGQQPARAAEAELRRNRAELAKGTPLAIVKARPPPMNRGVAGIDEVLNEAPAVPDAIVTAEPCAVLIAQYLAGDVCERTLTLTNKDKVSRRINVVPPEPDVSLDLDDTEGVAAPVVYAAEDIVAHSTTHGAGGSLLPPTVIAYKGTRGTVAEPPDDKGQPLVLWDTRADGGEGPARARPQQLVPVWTLTLLSAPAPDNMVAPGMSLRYLVRFRPRLLRSYRSGVVVCTEWSRFTVPLSASRQAPRMRIPASVDLGDCAVGGEAVGSARVENTGGWARIRVAPSPGDEGLWQVTPAEFCLGAGQSTTLSVVFRPSERGDYATVVTLQGDDGTTERLGLRGAAHFPGLRCKSAGGSPAETADFSLTFDPISVHAVGRKRVVFSNDSPLPLHYRWVSTATDDSDEPAPGVFRASPAAGIAPGSSDLVCDVEFCAAEIGQYRGRCVLVVDNVPVPRHAGNPLRGRCAAQLPPFPSDSENPGDPFGFFGETAGLSGGADDEGSADAGYVVSVISVSAESLAAVVRIDPPMLQSRLRLPLLQPNVREVRVVNDNSTDIRFVFDPLPEAGGSGAMRAGREGSQRMGEARNRARGGEVAAVELDPRAITRGVQLRFEPREALVPARSSFPVSVHFTFLHDRDVDLDINCWVERAAPAKLRILATTEAPRLQVTPGLLDLQEAGVLSTNMRAWEEEGDMAKGTVERQVTLTNPSEAPVAFRIFNARDLANLSAWQNRRAALVSAVLSSGGDLSDGDIEDFRPHWRFSPPFELIKPHESREVAVRYTPPTSPGDTRDTIKVIAAPPLHACTAVVESIDAAGLQAFAAALRASDPPPVGAGRLAEAVCVLLGVPSPGQRVLLPLPSELAAPGAQAFLTPPGGQPGQDFSWCTVGGVRADAVDVQWGDGQDPDPPPPVAAGCSVPRAWWDDAQGGNARAHAPASAETLAELITLDPGAVADHIRALDVSRRGLGVDAPLGCRGGQRLPRLMDYDDLIHFSGDEVWQRISTLDRDTSLDPVNVGKELAADPPAALAASRLATWFRLVVAFCRALRGGMATVRVRAEVQEASACVSPPALHLGALYQGVPVERAVSLKNLSGLDMEFCWAPITTAVSVDFHPSNGQLLAGQSLAVKVRVVARRRGPLDCVVVCAAREVGSQREQHLALNLTAEQVHGLSVSAVASDEAPQHPPALDVDDGLPIDDYCGHLVKCIVSTAVGEAEPLLLPTVDFGEVPLFASATRYLTLRNHSGCETSFTMRVRKYPAPPRQRSEAACKLLASPPVGTLSATVGSLPSPAHSTKSGTRSRRIITLGKAHEELRFTAAAGQQFAISRREAEESQRRARAQLSARRGCAVELGTASGDLAGGDVVVVPLTLYNDMVGQYNDTVELLMDGMPPAQVALSATCRGPMVSLSAETPGLTLQPSQQNSAATLTFPPMPPGAPPCKKRLQCRNDGPVDIELRWGLHAGPRLVEVALSEGSEDAPVKVALRDSPPGSACGPLSLEPLSAIIPARGTATFTAIFAPTAPGDYRASLRCTTRTAEGRANHSWLQQQYNLVHQQEAEASAAEAAEEDHETTPSQSAAPARAAAKQHQMGMDALPEEEPDSSDEEQLDQAARAAKERRAARQARRDVKRQEEEWVQAHLAERRQQEAYLAWPIDIDVSGTSEPCMLESDPPGGVVKLPNCRGGPPPFLDPQTEGYVRWVTLRNPSTSSYDFRLSTEGPFALAGFRFNPSDAQAPPPAVARTKLTQGKQGAKNAGYTAESEVPRGAQTAQGAGQLRSSLSFTKKALARVAEGPPGDLVAAGHCPKGRGTGASRMLFRLRRGDSIEVAVELQWNERLAAETQKAGCASTLSASRAPAGLSSTLSTRGHQASADLARVTGGFNITFSNGEVQRLDLLAMMHYPAVSCAPTRLTFGERDDDREPSWPKRILLSSLTPAPARFSIVHVPVSKPITQRKAADLAVSRLEALQREVAAQFAPPVPKLQRRAPAPGDRVVSRSDQRVVLRRKAAAPLPGQSAAGGDPWVLDPGEEATVVSVHFGHLCLRDSEGELSELTAEELWRYPDGSLCLGVEPTGPAPIDDPSVFEFAVGGVRGRTQGALPGSGVGGGGRERAQCHLGATAQRTAAFEAKADTAAGRLPMGELSEAVADELRLTVGSGPLPKQGSLERTLGVRLASSLAVSAGGANETAGLREGMVLSHVAGNAVRTLRDAQAAFAATQQRCEVAFRIPQEAEVRERQVEVYFRPRGTAVFESRFRVDVAGGRGCEFTLRGVSAQTEHADLAAV
eukprot:TRINITY_DN2944_c0_g1_i4.p1 TRINITY_DN2944_c0_g1~~TRINITY_DN2944_c0_g1_i4.p1  ORF type:complete len:2292 (+),score=566.42 TRINITY_DN2944_c0_g1_i4:508-7383(+)